MKYLKEEKPARNPLLVPVIVLSLVVVGLSAMLMLSVFGNRAEAAPQAVQAPMSNKNYVVETEDGQVVEEDFLETPYCKLYYPAQWKESMDGAVTETAEGCRAVFTGKVADKEIKVFAIYFGEAGGNAFPVGSLKTENGDQIAVSAELFDLEMDDSWTQEEIDMICAMQESINHVIAKIGEESAFVADK